MKSWTRTLTFSDAHTLLSLAEPHMTRSDWEKACYDALDHVPSRPRQTGLIRLVRENFLAITGDGRIDGRGLFFRLYRSASAASQEALVRVGWALSHDITMKAVEELVVPANKAGDNEDIPLMRVDKFVKKHVNSKAPEALRKTRTILLDALSGLGCVVTKGTGRNRFINAHKGTPDPVAFAYLILRELEETNRYAMPTNDAIRTSMAAKATQCTIYTGLHCIADALQSGLLVAIDDEVAMPEAAAA